MAKGIIILVVASMIAAVWADCGAYGVGHTMCKTAADCSQVTGVCGPVLTDDMNIILNEHNDYRTKIANHQEKRGDPGPQPAGTNIYAVSWNQELADIAQRWAEQGTYGHDCSFSKVDGAFENTCRKTDTYRMVGQNIFYDGLNKVPAKADWSKAIKDWISEVTAVNKADFGSPSGNTTGHYTQVVWSSTKEVGCGVFGNNVKCNFMGWPNHYCLTYVCNYGPPGNMYQTPPYSTTETCNKYSSVYTSLCSD